MKSASNLCKSWLWILVLLFAWTPSFSEAQVGRTFHSVEALVGSARIVYVGKIVKLEPIEYDKPLTDTQKIGKPYELVFKISETIRGEEVKQLDLILSLQGTWDLEPLNEYAADLLLVGGPGSFRRGVSEIGIEAQKAAADEWFQFLLLDPVEVPEDAEGAKVAKHLNSMNDSRRMFTNEFKVVQGSDKVLKRARDHVKKHPQILKNVSVRIPNKVGSKCGHPEAFCSIELPICPITLQTLNAIKKDSTKVMGEVEAYEKEWGKEKAKEYYEFERNSMLKSIDKAIAELNKEFTIEESNAATSPSQDETSKTTSLEE